MQWLVFICALTSPLPLSQGPIGLDGKAVSYPQVPLNQITEQMSVTAVPRAVIISDNEHY